MKQHKDNGELERFGDVRNNIVTALDEARNIASNAKELILDAEESKGTWFDRFRTGKVFVTYQGADANGQVIGTTRWDRVYGMSRTSFLHICFANQQLI
ncbi:hypothetical protein N7495_004184 [Penicillium taxi]|uniref:uncharacterized protein n=1 Tax=Penicillium taxi TaxID=168475 RepID=UPI0025452DA7|nr:uncharacterized protein N7495_004184 [Penicillium taxi]KAJ5899440.1 hypothetical protein N7495_004184 [Penicillium taxi]